MLEPLAVSVQKRGRRASRQKGDRREGQVVELLRLIGCNASRVPLSGGAVGRFAGDVVLQHALGRVAMQGEVKARASGEGFASWSAGSPIMTCCF